MTDDQPAYLSPRWLRDFLRFLPLKSQFVLTGNIRDLQPFEAAPGLMAVRGLTETLQDAFISRGYQSIILWNPACGFKELTAPDAASPAGQNFLTKLGLSPGLNGAAPGGPEILNRVVGDLINLQNEPAALIVDYASRLAVDNHHLAPAEHQLFLRALVASYQAKARPLGPGGNPLFNTIIWLTEKETDLPDWFTIGNHRLRQITIGRPNPQVRAALAASMLRILPDAPKTRPEEIKKAAETFADATEGLLLTDMNAIAQLAKMEEVSLVKIADAVRRYKVGITEDPWLRLNTNKIKNAETLVTERVKGQKHAVRHMLDIVKRAVTQVGGGRRGNRPRGVAFLAGPTGVGKTELAKAITGLLFGDENAYIRFDMSEFSAEHADQRLLGAPPGYVGYDAGGELTNAIKEKPFSVVLFDEIEKAHPRVMDKFLQILDDGVLTSGRGDRVYFSEALIIFTSNLGVSQTEQTAAAQNQESFEGLQQKILSAIRRHFRENLNRPELLNRIGENIIVFDFIRPETAEEIFDQMLKNILEDLTEQGYDLKISPQAVTDLKSLCLRDLSHGGRGIRNQLEAKLLNPLARAIFDQGVKPGDKKHLEEIGHDGLVLN